LRLFMKGFKEFTWWPAAATTPTVNNYPSHAHYFGNP
jgi:hypothetical protein